MSQTSGWVGCDFDGTLAVYPHPEGRWPVPGPPVPKMVRRIKDHILAGDEVRIVTARVAGGGTSARIHRQHVEAWCLEHIGKILDVTAEKDFGMRTLYDDRCKQVVPNTGELIEELLEECREEVERLTFHRDSFEGDSNV